jgi:WD40 repeat protein
MTDVYKLKKKNKKKHRLLKASVSVLVLAIISVVAAILITNNGRLNVEGLMRLFSGTGGKAEAEAFSYNAGFKTVFAEINGGLAVCSNTGVQVYDVNAKKMFSEAFEMANPSVCSNGAVTAVYDLGGKLLKIYDLYGVTNSLKTDGEIVSASMNKNGWLALCTQENGSFKGRVTVYNDNNTVRFYWDSAKGHILSAAISPDNQSLAVLTLTDGGSRIVFFSLDSTDEKGSCTISGELVLEIRYLSDGRVLAVGSDKLQAVKPDGSADIINDYSDSYLTGYSVDSENYTVLSLNAYMVGDHGRILTVDHKGKVLGSIETDRKILSISAKNDYLAVLFSDHLVIYDGNMKECARFENTTGAEQTIMRAGGKAFLITAHSASVYSISNP